MKKSLTFRKAQGSDLKKIANFRKIFPNVAVEDRQPNYYLWKCKENPIQKGQLWVAEDRGKIVGMKSVTPKYMKILGRELTVGEIGDSFTHREYRRQGIFTVLSKAARDGAIENGASFIYHTPNENSRPGYKKKLNHGEIPSLRLRSLFRPLNLRRIFRKKFGWFPFSSGVGFALEVCSRTILRLKAIESKKCTIVISHVSLVPNDIKELWEKLSKNYQIILVRDKKYLEWRFVKALGDYLMLVARSKDGKILGYIVGKVVDHETWRRGYIADFFTIEDHPKIFNKLVLSLLEEFRKKGVDIAITWAVKSSFYDKAFSRFGFLPRGKVPVLCYKNDLGKQIIEGNYNWHFTLADSDNI